MKKASIIGHITCVYSMPEALWNGYLPDVITPWVSRQPIVLLKKPELKHNKSWKSPISQQFEI